MGGGRSACLQNSHSAPVQALVFFLHLKANTIISLQGGDAGTPCHALFLAVPRTSFFVQKNISTIQLAKKMNKGPPLRDEADRASYSCRHTLRSSRPLLKKKYGLFFARCGIPLCGSVSCATFQLAKKIALLNIRGGHRLSASLLFLHSTIPPIFSSTPAMTFPLDGLGYIKYFAGNIKYLVWCSS